MGRKPKLVPTYEKKRGQWVLSIPASMSATGERERLYWGRGEEEKAKAHARALRDAKAADADLAGGVTRELVEAAVRWDRLLVEIGFRGLDHFCATKYEEMMRTQESPLLQELLSAFQHDHRKNWTDAYFNKRWRPFRARLSEIEAVRVSEQDETYWREWFTAWNAADGPSPATYNQQLGMLRSIFDLSAARKVHPHNPLADLPGAKDRNKAVPVSTAGEVMKLLATAWEHDREMVPYFAACYFAGPRPDSEAKRIHFEHFNWKTNRLKIGVTKTSHSAARYVEIEEALREWMQPWMRKKGSIIPNNFAKRRRRLIYGFYTTPGATISDESKWKHLVPWGHDITRHTYGSMWEAAHRGQAGCWERLANNMGHTGIKTFKRNYENTRTEEEAEEFWSIRPLKEDNVIAIA
jgi:site-specific recombinase XerD